MNKENLAFYCSLTTFLGKTLGRNFEIILHVLDTDNYHIAAIENNHISGRTINSPITGFALELIKSKKHLTEDYVVDYKSQTVNGKNLKGSTFFIRGKDGSLEGMLCINQDTSLYEELSRDILSLAGLTSPCDTVFDTPHIQPSHDSIEVLEDSIEGIVHSVISPDLLDQKILLSKELKLEIISNLNDKGIFQIKGAVARVAEILNISEPSVYRYIKIVECK